MSLRQLHFGALTLDLGRMALVGAQGPIGLRPKSFDVLRYLVDHPGRVVTKTELIAAVWPDVVVTDESLTRCISDIRRALGGEGQSLVRTVPRRGYVFDGRVTVSVSGALPGKADGGATELAAQEARPNGATANASNASSKKQVTVLHIGIGDGPDAATRTHPERALEAHALILKTLGDACRRFAGVIASVTEDNVVALFGAVAGSEDHAVQACHAAWELRNTIGHEEKGCRLTLGIASGEVIVHALSPGEGPNAILAFGPPAGLAKRLSKLAGGDILVSSATRQRALGFIKTRDRHLPEMSGQECTAFELVALERVETRFQVSAARGLTPFVGRGAEIDDLKGAAKAAFDGSGRITVIIGEPGVGKSRLLHEFMLALRPQGASVLIAGALSHREPTSFQVFSNIIKAYLEIEAGDDAAIRRRKVSEAVAALNSDDRMDLFACLSLIDEPVDAAAWIALDPSLRRDRVLGVGKKLLLNAARTKPLVLLLEDLHWLDADSQDAMNSIVDSIALMPVLVVATFRPEYSHRWHGKSYYSQIHLDELHLKPRRELLNLLIGHDETVSECIALLERQGNPLFLEELVRSLADEGILRGERGAYQLARPIDDEFKIPAAVQAVLSARIDRLGASERLVLQAASIVGDRVPARVMLALIQLPGKEIEDALGKLQAAELLYEDRSSSDRCFRFKHTLTRSVAYESQLDDQRRSLHGAVVASIEALYPDKLFEHAEQLSHHATRGKMGIVAVRYALQAGAKAFARSANAEAVRHYEDALTALKATPEDLEKREYAVDIRCELRSALYSLAEFRRIEAYLREAEAIASTLDDQQRLGWVSAYLSSLYLTGGRSANEARALAARASAIADAYKNSKLLVAAQYYLTWAGYISGDYEQTERICRRLMKATAGARERERFGIVFPSIQSRDYCARALAERGEFGEAELLARDGIRLSMEFDHPFSISWSYLALGHVLSTKGDLADAELALEHGLEQCARWKIDSQTPLFRACLGYVRVLRGAVASGRELLEQAVEAYTKTGMEHFLSASIVQLGEAYLASNEIDAARSSADRAFGLATRRGEHGFRARARRLRGAVATERQSYEKARHHYDKALHEANDLKMRPLAARCHSDLCTLSRLTGDALAARQHDAAAEALYAELGMKPLWKAARSRRGLA